MQDALENILDTENGKPRVRALMVGKSRDGVTVAGGQFVLTWQVPKGYKKCTGVFYDPADDLSLTIYSENLVSNMISNMSTATGSAVGMVNPMHEYAERDTLTATIVPNVLSSTPKKVTITLRFE